MSSSSVDWLGNAILKIIPFLILLGFLFVVGAFPKIKQAFTDTEQFVNESFGLEEQQAVTPTLPGNQEQAILGLKEALNDLSNNDYYRNCWITYADPLPDLENTRLIITYDESEDVTRVLTEGGGQIITNLTFSVPGIRPCVVAGLPQAANFSNSFLLC